MTGPAAAGSAATRGRPGSSLQTVDVPQPAGCKDEEGSVPAGAAAEAFYAGPWLDGIRERYGTDPQIKFFETACITGNAAGTVMLPGGAK
jgi:hypothetical protein